MKGGGGFSVESVSLYPLIEVGPQWEVSPSGKCPPVRRVPHWAMSSFGKCSRKVRVLLREESP